MSPEIPQKTRAQIAEERLLRDVLSEMKLKGLLKTEYVKEAVAAVGGIAHGNMDEAKKLMMEAFEQTIEIEFQKQRPKAPIQVVDLPREETFQVLPEAPPGEAVALNA